MRKLLCTIAVGLLGTWTAAAQTSASAQAGASAQSQTSVQSSKTGTNASGSGAGAESVSPNDANSSAKIADGSKIDATLVSTLDTNHNKPGDRFEARTTQDVKQDGKVVLKKGTRLVGHVTQAQARAKGQTQSQLGVVFDHAILAKGQEVPFNASIQALAVAQSAATATAGADDMMASGGAMGGMSGGARSGGGLVGGVASSAGATAGSVMNASSSVPSATGGTLSTVTRSTGAVGGLTTAGQLTSNSSGVFGLRGMSLDSATSGAAQGSMIVSSTRNVHLDSGTQMLLKAGGQIQ
jgi:hypothetical protein